MQLHLHSKFFGDNHVLGEINLTLKENEVTVLFGPSGCGKSTLLNILTGLDENYEGRIQNHNEKIAMVFQEPRLLPWLTVRENIELVAQDVDVEAIVKDVGVFEAIDLPAAKLSLGMARRVSFARAISINPDVLVMDEPFVSLDEERAESLRFMVLDLIEKRSFKALFVTHDLKEAVQLGNRILVLEQRPSTIVYEKQIDLSSNQRRNKTALENYLRTFALS